MLLILTNSQVTVQKMSIHNFIEKIRSDASSVSFEETMEIIASHFTYQPTTFTNGSGDDCVTNTAGTNEGSCKIFAFAKLNGLTPDETLACFGKYYREDVLQNPEGSDHANIRTFMRYGWNGIHFEGEALTAN